MAKKHFGSITLVNGQIINLSAENLESDPTFNVGDEGIIIYNTVEKAFKYNNGSSWVTFQTSATSSNVLIETLGIDWVDTNLKFNPTNFNGLDNITGLSVTDSLFDVIVQLDSAITDAKTVEALQGIDLDLSGLSSGNIIFFDGTAFVVGTLSDLDAQDLDFDDLSNVSFDLVQNNQIVVAQGSNWVNRPFIFKYQELSNSINVFTVNHSLGERFCHVTIIDMNQPTPRIIDPSLVSSVQFNSESTLTVTLTVNRAVTILVSSLNFS